MALPLATLDDIIQFAEPAYTYILTFPYTHWQRDESRLQKAFGYPNSELLDNPELYLNMPGPDSPVEQNNFLETRGPEKSYSMVLAHMAHMAAYNIFSQKQGKSPPVASIYSQCELGKEKLHIHMILAGDGLNRYNAKAIRSQLLYKWCDNMQSHIEYNLKQGHNTDPTFCNILLDLFMETKRRCNSSPVTHCEILQYKSRSGEMYACRIDPREFICNYLLCKNLKFFTITDPERATPFVSSFGCTNKTYAASFVNGKWIPIQARKQWLNFLRDSICKKAEPVFSGDLFDNLPKVSKSAWQQSNNISKSKITKRESLMLDCIDRCEKNHWLTYEDLVNGCSDLVVMLESQAGGSKLIENILGMVHIKICQKYTALSYILFRYESIDVTTSNKVWKLLTYQGYNPWQTGHWVCCVLNKCSGKQNTISFYGPASTGKTNLAKAIVNTVKLYGCVNHQNRNFVFNDCAAKLIVWWEECLMHTDWVEQAKCIMGGTEFRIDRKHRDSHLLPQTPLLLSTNNDIYTVTGGNVTTHVHSKPIRERVVQFNFMKQLSPTFGEITVEDVVSWLQACYNRFTISLDGFHSEWRLDKTPNDFPLAKFCDNHSQDLILYEHGICNACGGYYPLETRDRGEIETKSPITPIDLSGEPLYNIYNLDIPENEYLTNFDLSLLATPSPEKLQIKRPRSPSPQPSTSAIPETPKKPKKVRRQLFEDNYEQLLETSTIFENEVIIPETSESESTGLTPSDWGEMLGIITRSLEDEPIVLHCFENISDLENDSDSNI
nr:MAG: NS1 [Parvovirinae sp.]